MKQIIEDLIKLIEESKGDQEIIEKKINEYHELNREMIESSGQALSKKLDQAMGSISNPSDFAVVMQTMFKVMTDEIGEENFKKLMELQEKYPSLKDMTKKIIPGKK
jgi:TRAP-type C4-dicarboxylate transport system substrate-binding protein